MIWIILLTIILGLILFVLVTPLIIRIDTRENIYLIRWAGLVRMQILPDTDKLLVINVRSLFWNKDFYPLTKRVAKEQKDEPAKPSKKKKRSLRYMSRRAWHVLRSFRVRQFSVDLDTGDYIWNAYLYPVFWFLNTRKRHLYINYEGRVTAKIEIRNRLIRMLYAFIQ